MYSFLINEHKEACRTLEYYMHHKSEYYFIHYSCENFKSDLPYVGKRIVGIGVLNAKTQSLELFSLKNSADILNVNVDKATDKELDEIELNLLESYFSFLKHHENSKYVHWRMNNDCYGFKCLERRFLSLGGNEEEIFKINEDNTVNLSLLIKNKYGKNYARTVNGNKGSMYSLFELNDVKRGEILDGKIEAELLNEKKYDKVYFSLTNKLYALYEIVDLAGCGKLKTYTKVIKEIYGTGIVGIFKYIEDNALLAFVFSILGWALGLLIQFILKNHFNINI